GHRHCRDLGGGGIEPRGRTTARAVVARVVERGAVDAVVRAVAKRAITPAATVLVLGDVGAHQRIHAANMLAPRIASRGSWVTRVGGARWRVRAIRARRVRGARDEAQRAGAVRRLSWSSASTPSRSMRSAPANHVRWSHAEQDRMVRGSPAMVNVIA